MYVLQVDDLKDKLAAQEVELKQKNEDADALIQTVGVEQEKVCIECPQYTGCPMAAICFLYACMLCFTGVHTQVGKEKEIADEEEKKVGKINEEVSKKQRDCERDLAKAEPALQAAVEALNTLNKVHIIIIFQ